MPTILVDSLFVCSVVLFFYLSRRWSKKKDQSLPLPPGPRGLPLIGNFFDMIVAKETKTLDYWRDKYGPIVYLNVFGTSYIYVNDFKTLSEMFEKRGSIYSSRPDSVMNKLEGWSSWFVTSLPYGPELRLARQKLHRYLQQPVIPSYFTAQTTSAYNLAARLIEKPEDFRNSVRLAAAEVIMKVTYDYDVKEDNDPFVNIAEKGIEAFSDAQAYRLVNDIPWLQHLPPWLPGMGFLKVAKQGYIDSMNMYRKPFESFKAGFEWGEGQDSITGKLLENMRDKNGGLLQVDEDFTAKVTSIIYAGGADTTVSLLLTFILAMVLHPDIQKRAQEEVDTVVGKNTLPTFEDLPKLKYVDAIRKECLRWETVVVTAVPHTVSEDDEVLGFHIPANSVIMGNIWAILRDPIEYPDPEQFIPERFLPGKEKKKPLEPSKISFSIGRRICPGRHFAENSTFIDIATMLATCDFQMAVNVDGKFIIPDASYTELLVRHPEPFKCMIKPRSKEAYSLLRQAIEAK